MAPMNPLARFEMFVLTPAESEAVRTEFVQILNGSVLSKTESVADVIKSHKKVACIYFWILRHEQAQYKIYIGKTNSLSYRLLNYISEFQPHSPNDYKLRIFHAFIMELVPTAALDLYFANVDISVITQAETAAIGKYNPLLNNLPSPTPDARDSLKKAFALYYESAFEQRLVNVAQPTVEAGGSSLGGSAA